MDDLISNPSSPITTDVDAYNFINNISRATSIEITEQYEQLLPQLKCLFKYQVYVNQQYIEISPNWSNTTIIKYNLNKNKHIVLFVSHSMLTQQKSIECDHFKIDYDYIKDRYYIIIPDIDNLQYNPRAHFNCRDFFFEINTHNVCMLHIPKYNEQISELKIRQYYYI
jgi:hypothetical protein